MSEAMKTEVSDGCSVCSSRTGEVATLEEHDATLQDDAPLRTQFLSLSQHKRLPTGPVCCSCVSRAQEAYRFQTALSLARPPPLSCRIEALRRKLLQLSRRIDVFLVVGDAAQAGQVGHEHEVIMVDRAALEQAADARALQPAADTRGDHVYQCTVCPQTFHKVSTFTAHTSTHPVEAPHSCWTCGAQFTSREACLLHATQHSARSCPACGAPAPPSVTTCRSCQATLPPTPAAPRRHYVCGYDGCILRFATRNSLLAHIRKTHGAPEEPAPGNQCGVCRRTFGSAAALKRHARVHEPQAEEPGMVVEENGEAVEVEYLEVEELEELPTVEVKTDLLDVQ